MRQRIFPNGRSAWLIGLLSLFVLTRVAVAAQSSYGFWPFIRFDMFSNHRNSTLHVGVPMIGAVTKGGTCRIPTTNFGSRRRVRIYMDLLRKDPGAIFQRAQSICGAALGKSPACDAAEFILVYVRLGADYPYSAKRYLLQRDQTHESQEQPVEHYRAFFPDGFCRSAG